MFQLLSETLCFAFICKFPIEIQLSVADFHLFSFFADGKSNQFGMRFHVIKCNIVENSKVVSNSMKLTFNFAEVVYFTYYLLFFYDQVIFLFNIKLSFVRCLI